MEIYLFFVIVLLFLGAVDLNVGIANDAVNFLNTAVGSKVTTFRKALIVASLGVLIGVTFSSGMMEIARKGIFNPQYFTMPELLIIFLAVMFADIILLDFFNTFGLPTSTTVSLVSGMFGGALTISVIKTIDANQDLSHVFTYLNTSKILSIYSAILVSILFAFLFGFLVQFISRIIFTFKFRARYKRFGALWGGIALTLINYFIIIEGIEGASFATPEMIEFIESNVLLVLAVTLVFWTILLQIINSFTKFNSMKLIVLIGTFALAWAFAANDLVNFIGAPLAGLAAYQTASNYTDPLNVLMTDLSKPAKANTLILLLAGAIMITTLFLSKKARSVTRTEVSLGRQEEGVELYDSYPIVRALVRMVINVNNFFLKFVPNSIRSWVRQRLDTSNLELEKDAQGNEASFDFVRATVNLMVASALISVGTHLKLPLSTTYVTFIVAMSTALADRAWGTESAVYRVSGVMTVIGGWLLTAVIASLIAGLIATTIYYTSVIGVVLFLGLVSFILIRTAYIHKKRDKEIKLAEEKLKLKVEKFSHAKDFINQNISSFANLLKETINTGYTGTIKRNLKLLKKFKNQSKELRNLSDSISKDLLNIIQSFDDSALESGHHFANILSAINSISDSNHHFATLVYGYVDNNHKKFSEVHINDLKKVNKMILKIIDLLDDSIQNGNYYSKEKLKDIRMEFQQTSDKILISHIKSLKQNGITPRMINIILHIIKDTQHIVEQLLEVIDSYKQIQENLKIKIIELEDNKNL